MQTKTKNMIKEIEMAEIFKVEIVDGEKRVNRWGFFADQGDGTYAVYKPARPTCSVHEYFMLEEDGPGDIEIVDKKNIEDFLNNVDHELQSIAGTEVSTFTPCGWYYDTIV